MSWKQKYEMVQKSFMELAIGNSGAYDKRKELEESVQHHMRMQDELRGVIGKRDSHIRFLESKISQMRRKAKARAKKK